jgi:hypothetical protein
MALTPRRGLDALFDALQHAALHRHDSTKNFQYPVDFRVDVNISDSFLGHRAL